MKSFVAIILPIYFLLTNSMLARSFLLKALHSSRLPGATINQSIIRPSSKTDIKTFNMGLSSSSTAASSSDRSNSKKVLVPVANGSEEIETVTIIDTLVRGGINVCVATVHSESLQVVCSRGVKLMAGTYSLTEQFYQTLQKSLKHKLTFTNNIYIYICISIFDKYKCFYNRLPHI